MTLPTPDSALRACVVVPARNEEALVGPCLEALAAQAGVESSEYEVLPDTRGATQHWQFSGASLGLAAELYRQIGGLESLATLEDEALEKILRGQHVPIERLLSVRVTTSPRLEGKARRGLSYDLSRMVSGS
jgi:hypothetical protein